MKKRKINKSSCERKLWNLNVSRFTNFPKPKIAFKIMINVIKLKFINKIRI